MDYGLVHLADYYFVTHNPSFPPQHLFHLEQTQAFNTINQSLPEQYIDPPPPSQHLQTFWL